MSLSDCIKCWDTPCHCGWYEVGARPSARVEFLKKVADWTNHDFSQFSCDQWHTKTCKNCGFQLGYRDYNLEAPPLLCPAIGVYR